MSSHRRRSLCPGFTLIEIVIVIAVLSLFVILAWTLLSGWMGSGVTSIWRQTCSRELGTLSSTLRQDLSKASYPSAVTPENTFIASREEFFIKILGEDAGDEVPDWDADAWTDFKVNKVGPGKAGAVDPAEEPVLEIIQGTPGKARIPGFAAEKVKATRVTYFLKDGARVFGKAKYCNAVKDLWVRQESGELGAEDFDPDAASFTFANARTRKMVQGVNCILMGVSNGSLSGDASEPTSSPAVKMKILCVEPSDGKAKISVTVTAGGQTGVKFGS